MYQETTKPLMRPRQVEDAKDELRRLEVMMQAPPHVSSGIQDIGEIRRQAQDLKRSLDGQAPKPYVAGEIDDAVKYEADLRESWLAGMPTQKEMRRNPSGARDKHRKWDHRAKQDVLKWKNVRLRLHASGVLDELPDATDIANIEQYRPHGGAAELNMDHEQIQGRIQHGPVPGAGPAVVFSDHELDTLKSSDPEMYDRLAMMSNEHRALVKSMLRSFSKDVPPLARAAAMDHLEAKTRNPQPVKAAHRKPKKGGRKYTPEQRAEIGARLKAAREAKRQEG